MNGTPSQPSHDPDGREPSTLFDRAREYLLAGNTATADTILQRGRLLAPDDAAMAYLHGLCLMQADDPRSAAEAFAAVLRLDPGNGRAALLLSRALCRAGDRAEASRWRTELERRHPGDPALLNELAADLLEEGDEPAAARLLDQAIQASPDDPDVLHNLGVACARLGSLERAEMLLRRSLERRQGMPARRDASEAALAGVLATRGFFDEAEAIAGGLLDRGAEEVHAWTVLGTVAARQRRPAAAVEALLKAEALAPADPGVLSNLAAALDEGGRVGEAEERWRRLAACGHGEAEARTRLASRTPAAGEAIRRLLPLDALKPPDGGPVELSGIDLCIDQWHLVQDDRLALDLVFTPPLGASSFVAAADGTGFVLVRDDLDRHRIDEPAVFLGGTGNYYHWMLDTLPRLAAVQGLDGRLLVNSAPNGFQMRTLGLMGVPSSRLMVPDAPALTRFARLTVPGLVSRPRRADGQMDWMVPSVGREAAAWVRDRLMDGIAVRPRKPGRILVSREGSLFRRCDNEGVISQVAARRGFVTVRLEELSFDEQVSLFAGAEIVMGVHGAGFTNMLFAPPGALLIELHPAGHLPEFYRHLTRLMGQGHAAIGGALTQALRPAREYNWNFRIDPAELDLRLAELGA
ncbi:glycosyltransferase 61 family protein [Skermanella mucosa]|uniref:glycosyltransferase 61 family protein n=1 Tax=Skermanella mucosa TaxID=1789672 RepID=UPI00192BAFA2|nr:glycosyltransferase 61 family protein [Skermanella mucosa]UEM22346.1 glycosyltransferase 61 family protein [Skermanella mucosa]